MVENIIPLDTCFVKDPSYIVRNKDPWAAEVPPEAGGGITGLDLNENRVITQFNVKHTEFSFKFYIRLLPIPDQKEAVDIFQYGACRIFLEMDGSLQFACPFWYKRSTVQDTTILFPNNEEGRKKEWRINENQDLFEWHKPFEEKKEWLKLRGSPSGNQKQGNGNRKPAGPVMKIAIENKNDKLVGKWMLIGWRYKIHERMTNTSLTVFVNEWSMEKNIRGAIYNYEPMPFKVAHSIFSCIEYQEKAQPDEYFFNPDLEKCSKFTIKINIFCWGPNRSNWNDYKPYLFKTLVFGRVK